MLKKNTQDVKVCIACYYLYTKIKNIYICMWICVKYPQKDTKTSNASSEIGWLKDMEGKSSLNLLLHLLFFNNLSFIQKIK